MSFLRLTEWGVHLLVFLCAATVYYLCIPPSHRYWGRVLWITLAHMALGGGYLFNDFCDRRADAAKPGRGWLSPRARSAKLGLALVLIAAGLGIVHWQLPDPWSVVIAWSNVALGLAYSAPGIRLKERGLIGLIGPATLQRLPPFAMLLVGVPLNGLAAAAILAWLFVMGLLFILEHQLEDFEADTRVGVRTFVRATRLGQALRIRERLYRVFGLLSGLVPVAFMVSRPEPRTALGAFLLVAVSGLFLALIRRRYRLNQRLPESVSGRGTARFGVEYVRIYGAGLSGLVAAIKLAQWGFRVEVHETLRVPGGMAAARPAVHSSLLDPIRLERYLGIPMAECFTRVSRETSYLYGKRSPTPRRHLNCTRGAIPGALDRHLLDLVRTHGVEVQWSSAFTATVNRPGPGAIIATGHSSRPYQLLGIPCEALEAYWAAMPYDGEPILVSYRSDYTDPDYAYVASRDGWISALLFARGRPIEGGALERFQKELYETEGIRFDRWKRGRGAAPLAPRFEVGGFRVAGALGGMIDPFYLSGVAAALISGGLAALSFVDPIHARFEYQRLTRHFRLKRLLRAGMQCRGAPRALRFALMVLDRIPQPVGALR